MNPPKHEDMDSDVIARSLTASVDWELSKLGLELTSGDKKKLDAALLKIVSELKAMAALKKKRAALKANPFPNGRWL